MNNREDRARAMAPGVDYPVDGTTIVTDPPPSVGRIVHVGAAPECWAAIITGIDGKHVWLWVMPPGHAAYDIKAKGDAWHWPERV